MCGQNRLHDSISFTIPASPCRFNRLAAFSFSACVETVISGVTQQALPLSGFHGRFQQRAVQWGHRSLPMSCQQALWWWRQNWLGFFLASDEQIFARCRYQVLHLRNNQADFLPSTHSFHENLCFLINLAWCKWGKAIEDFITTDCTSVPIRSPFCRGLTNSEHTEALGGVEQTYIDLSLPVTLEEVVHDGAVVKVLQRRHVLHPSGAAVVHGLHLLSGEGILLVGVHLGQSTQGTEIRIKTVAAGQTLGFFSLIVWSGYETTFQSLHESTGLS